MTFHSKTEKMCLKSILNLTILYVYSKNDIYQFIYFNTCNTVCNSKLLCNKYFFFLHSIAVTIHKHPISKLTKLNIILKIFSLLWKSVNTGALKGGYDSLIGNWQSASL